MKKMLAVAALSLAMNVGACAPVYAQQQQEKLLPGEAEHRLSVAFETNTQQASGLIVNAARVRAQADEIKRLEAEVKSLKEKCGSACGTPEKDAQK